MRRLPLAEQSDFQFDQPKNTDDDEGGAGHVGAIGEFVDRIRESALSETDNGRRFEDLVRQVLSH